VQRLYKLTSCQVQNLVDLYKLLMTLSMSIPVKTVDKVKTDTECVAEHSTGCQTEQH